MNNKRKAFTLIELIAVLVIMAIIALIVTPLVMNIIRKARISADKRSVDAYGRSIELAIAGYLLDNGKFPTEVSQLTIEYSGNQVVCETTQINTDSSVYLAGCTVAGRSVENYTYGSDKSPTYTAYTVGNQVTYNGVTYYVIEESDTTNDTVKLLKENPLTKTEMDNLNLTGITISEYNGYGAVEYGSTTDYATSTVKKVVDAWKNYAVKVGDNVTVRLITQQEISDNFGFEEYDIPCGGCGVKGNRIKNNLMYNSNYNYWIFDGKIVNNRGDVGEGPGISVPWCIRPVIVLPKSALTTS